MLQLLNSSHFRLYIALMDISQYWHAWHVNRDWWQAEFARLPISLQGPPVALAVAVVAEHFEHQGVAQPVAKAWQSIGKLELRFTYAPVTARS